MRWMTERMAASAGMDVPVFPGPGHHQDPQDPGALVLASGTTKAEINFGRKIGFGTTKNQMIGNNEDDKIDTGVDSHHRYGSVSRPETGN
ncbi:hypothetical protein E3N88_16103 [Mikania micrantha]|uniref:Uncharacterized protein n=1 Tax=Mikania micrantha TaxID=192012 RepID=A0A5N6NZK5_9ASTR|nr:hypothetical protein E3N88_16103 [Mikania micrantha]